ncbi:hypothetical protein H5410_020687 [Solanum commersonii]|uniref:Glycosyltransferase N-terminal domain-containing protein n=1 Tax=Solanum commersonii TaxID=4109 RepID=A0A9J5ZF00_SOLCO|nr:hypothetical protein H5410_020687 [Solanum commersonii]
MASKEGDIIRKRAEELGETVSEKSIQLGEELLKKLPPLEGALPDEVKNFMDFQSPYMVIKLGDIHNTSKVIEGEFLDLLAQVESKQQ